MKTMRNTPDNSAALVSAGGTAGVPAGGDLGGTQPSPQVVGIGGVPINPTPPTAGQVPVFDSGSGTIIWETASTAPSGAAGGDLGGTYPNPDVEAIDGVVLSGVPTAGQVLVATASAAAAWSTLTAVGQLVMQDGVTAPPVPIETEARDDWLYAG